MDQKNKTFGNTPTQTKKAKRQKKKKNNKLQQQQQQQQKTKLTAVCQNNHIKRKKEKKKRKKKRERVSRNLSLKVFPPVHTVLWFILIALTHRTVDWVDWPTAFSSPNMLPCMLPCGLYISDKTIAGAGVQTTRDDGPAATPSKKDEVGDAGEETTWL